MLAGKLLLYDGATCSFRKIKLRAKRKDCEICSESPTITKLMDYEQFCGMAATDKDSGLKILLPSQRISVVDFKNLHEKDNLLIDVRSANEFEICQLPNSINVPIKLLLADKIEENLRNLLREKKIYVVCRRGNDSQLAVKHLAEKLDITSKDLIGGLHAWTKEIDDNFPIY